METSLHDSGGEVYTWGSGEMGQLGLSPAEISSLPNDNDGYPYQPYPVPVRSLSGLKIVQVAGGDGHSVAVSNSGKVYSWGASACGQLGLRDIKDMPTDSEGYPYSPEPRLIESLLDFKIIQVSCGDAHTAALTAEGLVLSWGGGGCGQLGHPDTPLMPKDEDGCPYQPVPRVIESLTYNIKHIACGKAHTVAISEEGLSFTWGAGACGQLGHPDTSTFPYDEDGYPYHPTPKLVSSLKNIRLLMAACGDVHTLVLAEDGSVYCFGGGSFGQLGLGNIKNLPVDVDECPFMPVPKQIEALRFVKIVQIACGDSHSMALSESGELYGWGAAACGQLGVDHLQHLPRDAEDQPYEADPQLVRQLRGKTIVAVACGEAHTIALTDTGALYSFGASSCGQLGIPITDLTDNTRRRFRSQRETEQKSIQFQPLPRLINSLLSRKVISIACGGVHNVAVVESMPYTLASDLYYCYKKGLFTDITFKFNNNAREESISCHKVILAARSNYLRNLVRNKSVVSINYSRTSFAQLIDYLYLDDIEIMLDAISSCDSLSKATEFLQFACNFELQELQEACQNKLLQYLKPHLPPALSPDLVQQMRGLVFLPDGRAAIMNPDTYSRLLNESIVLETSAFTNRYESSTYKRSINAPLGKDLLNELNSDEFSDVTLMVENKPIHCHRVILAARSQFFSALYSHGFKESKEKVVELMDVEYNNILTLLTYIYSDDLPIPLDQIPEILTLCDRFSVPALKSRSEVELAASITVENSALLYKYAKAFRSERLKEVCLVFIEENFSSVIETQAFEDLEKDSMLEIMRFKKNYK